MAHVCYAVLRYISYAKFLLIREVLRDFHRLFKSRNSPTTSILHTVRHVYRSVCPPEKLSLALVLHSYILRMIVDLAYLVTCLISKQARACVVPVHTYFFLCLFLCLRRTREPAFTLTGVRFPLILKYLFSQQLQTRSADEPMTTFVLCLECGNRWKVSLLWCILTAHRFSRNPGTHAKSVVR